jgi:hypothetical protein
VTTIQLRGGTAAEWNVADPILAPREPGVETDTGMQKVGDGITPWSGLTYLLTESVADASFLRRTVAHDEGLDFATRSNPFSVFTASHTAGGVRDDMLKIGYNLDNSPGHVWGARRDSGDVAWQMNFEAHYWSGADGAPHYSEHNLDWWSVKGDYRRPSSVLIDRNSLNVYIEHRGTRIEWKTADGAVVAATLRTGLGRLGIGADPQAALHVVSRSSVNAKNEQLILSNDGRYHTGFAVSATGGAGYQSDKAAWGMYGGPSEYLTGEVNSVGLVLGPGVPKFAVHRNPNLNARSMSELFRISNSTPTSGETVVSLVYNNGSVVRLQRITLGEKDSAGEGYRLLRVPN